MLKVSVTVCFCSVSSSQQSRDRVQARNLVEGIVLRCVPVTVTVPTMGNVAAMDVDVSVWLKIQVFIYFNLLVGFLVISDRLYFIVVCQKY